MFARDAIQFDDGEVHTRAFCIRLRDFQPRRPVGVRHLVSIKLDTQGLGTRHDRTAISKAEVAQAAVNLVPPSPDMEVEFHRVSAGILAAGNVAVARENCLRSGLVCVQANEVTQAPVVDILPGSYAPACLVTWTHEHLGRNQLIRDRLKVPESLTA